jgi:hypothetical protein
MMAGMVSKRTIELMAHKTKADNLRFACLIIFAPFLSIGSVPLSATDERKTRESCGG